ncbi:unnamed protein product [Closterium sp. NIES-53]
MGDILQLTLVGATDLIDVKAWEIGKQDPYAVVVYNEYEFRTKVQEDAGKNPVFNETFSFPLSTNPTISITIFHDRKKHDDVIGVGKLAFASAFATGYVHEKLPLFTTEGRQQGFLEVVMRLPAVIERIQAQLVAAEAARRIEEMRIVEARAVYAAKLKDALKYRKQQAAAKADAQQEVMDGSLISLNNTFSYAMADHSSRTNTAKAAFLGADAASAEQLKAALVVDEPGFYAKLCKETEGEEEFRPEIDAYTGAVFAAARKRYGAVDKAKTDFETAVEEAVTNYLIKLQNIQTGFEKEAGEASKEYMKETRTKIFWKEEAQAESDVAAYKPPL